MNRRLMLMSFGGAAVLLGIWFTFLWAPQGNKLDAASKRTEVAESENSTLELRLTRLKAAQKDAPELMARGEKLRRAIPETPELAQFILDANDAASAAGVDFLSISPSPPAPAPGDAPSDIGLSISVTGTYFEIIDYLDRVAELPRLVVVDTLGLTPGGGGETVGTDQMSVSLTARMFTTAEQQPPGAAATSKGGTTSPTTAPPAGGSTTSVPASEQPVTTSTSTAPQITVTPNNG